jgi:segregation and condensation protein B
MNDDKDLEQSAEIADVDEDLAGKKKDPEESFVEMTVNTNQDVALPAHRDLSQEEMEHYRGLLEAVLFLSTEPVSLGILARKCNLDRMNTRIIVDSLVDDYSERDGGVLLREIAGGYQFITSDRYSGSLKEILKEQKKDRLSRSTIETLSIICYRQPITLPEIEEIRGVNSRAMVLQLVARKLIKPQGYRPVPGRPTLYVTTRNFLTQFALNSLADLPTLEDVKELNFDEID